MEKRQGSGESDASQLAARKHTADDHHSGREKEPKGAKVSAIAGTVFMLFLAFSVLSRKGDLKPQQLKGLVLGSVWVIWLWSRTS